MESDGEGDGGGEGVISNCVLFAIGRFWTRGGYVVVRKSDYGWWPHVLWSPDLVMFEQFHPVKHRRWYGVVLRLHLPLILFDGRAKPWVKGVR